MKKFTMLLLSVIFVTLTAGSVQSVTADHSEPGEGIFKDTGDVVVQATWGSNYQIYLQTVHRNGDGQLISVSEGTSGNGYIIPHKVTDHVFDALMGKKEIVTIDNIKYEKVQYVFSPTLNQRWIGMYPIFEEITIKFREPTENVSAKMNVKVQNYSIWKIHYCADFSSVGHAGYQCIPVFQVLVPTMTMEPQDVVTHQWTILRELN